MASGLSKYLRNFIMPAMLVSSAFAISACQSKTANLDNVDPMTTGSTKPGSFTKTAELGNRWNADQKNVELGLAYADGLEKMGQTNQQLNVLQTLSSQNPSDNKLQSLYAKKLIATGHAADSVPVLEAVTASGEGDWRTYSALGSAYDQQGQFTQARQSYEKALTMEPNQISVLNNLGMSYALEGNLKQGETTLRSAMALPDGKTNPRIRQNLALVVGLQGRFEESRKIASEDLPPDQVEANMAYLQKMLSQPNTWQQLSSDTAG
jgi:Flp pilus assembly protein TadD